MTPGSETSLIALVGSLAEVALVVIANGALARRMRGRSTRWGSSVAAVLGSGAGTLLITAATLATFEKGTLVWLLPTVTGIASLVAHASAVSPASNRRLEPSRRRRDLVLGLTLIPWGLLVGFDVALWLEDGRVMMASLYGGAVALSILLPAYLPLGLRGALLRVVMWGLVLAASYVLIGLPFIPAAAACTFKQLPRSSTLVG